MPHPVEKALFILFLTVCIASWIDSHTIRVETRSTVDSSGETHTSATIDLLCADEAQHEKTN